MRFEPGQRVELDVTSLATGGDGVARLEGRVIFVPGAAPGDRLLATLTEVRPRFARASLLEVLRAGPDRRDPPCEYAGRCGGCSWQHLGEDAQIAARESILREALTRIAGLRELPAIRHIRSPAALGYRARARVAYAGGRVGFRAAGSHEVVDVERCIVLDAETQRELQGLRAARPRGSGEVELRGIGKRVEVAGDWLSISPGSFFQANRSLWTSWVASVAELCGQGDLAIELYAGVGFYTSTIQHRFKRVIAVEQSRASTDLERNTHLKVITASAESWLPDQVGRLEPDLILINPPRVGCDRSVIHAIGALAPKRLVYVSCEPTTLARDISRLGEGFRLTNLVLLDALPQTHHVEAIATLNNVDIP